MSFYTDTEKDSYISVCAHPVALHNLSILRDKNTPAELFRNATKRLVRILFYQATSNLPLVKQDIETPITKTSTDCLDPESEVILAPILRAGLVFSEIASEFLPNARLHHLGLYRDETTLQPVSYYNNLPKTLNNPKNTFVYILDPMLATGGSAVSSVELFTSLNVPQENISFVCLISAPEGIQTLHARFPNIKIITACIDNGLNQNGYIVPGLGDAGDRTFNTIY